MKNLRQITEERLLGAGSILTAFRYGLLTYDQINEIMEENDKTDNQLLNTLTEINKSVGGFLKNKS